MKHWKSWILVLMAIVTMPSLAATAVERYPERPIRIVVPFPPGGPTDIYARLVAQQLQEKTGQSVVVENRPGGGAIIGTSHVARSPADGYTLLFTASTHVISVLLHKDQPYDPIKDFAPISTVLTYPFYLVVNNDLPVNSVSELIDYGKAHPGRLNFGSVGIGSGAHLVAEMFNTQAGIQAVHVPYKGAAAFVQAVQAGEVDYIFDSPGSSQQLVDAGRIRGFAVTSPERWPLVPDVPTMAEAGIPDFEASLWLGLLAPANTPAEIVAYLNDQLTEILASEEISSRIQQAGFQVLRESTDDYAQRLERDMRTWGHVIETAKIEAE